MNFALISKLFYNVCMLSCRIGLDRLCKMDTRI